MASKIRERSLKAETGYKSRQCIRCGKEYAPTSPTQKYCCANCSRADAKRRRLELLEETRQKYLAGQEADKKRKELLTRECVQFIIRHGLSWPVGDIVQQACRYEADGDDTHLTRIGEILKAVEHHVKRPLQDR